MAPSVLLHIGSLVKEGNTIHAGMEGREVCGGCWERREARSEEEERCRAVIVSGGSGLRGALLTWRRGRGNGQMNRRTRTAELARAILIMQNDAGGKTHNFNLRKIRTRME